MNSPYYYSDNTGYDSAQSEDMKRCEYVSDLLKKKIECCFLMKSEKMILKYCYLKDFSHAKNAKLPNSSPDAVRKSYLYVFPDFITETSKIVPTSHNSDKNIRGFSIT